MNYYPVIIPTLCRYEHFKRCVESLSRNTHADKTELVIGLDFPPAEKYRPGYEKIKNYIPQIKGFRKITVFYHKKNMGAVGNWRYCEDYCFKHYDAYIGTEDDNEFSLCFLDYMNKALEKYKDTQSILYVCGYSNFDLPNHKSVYAAKAMSAWGCGCWKNKMDIINSFRTSHYAMNILNSWRLSLTLFLKRANSLNSIINQICSNQFYGDACAVCYCLLNDTYSLFPSHNLVRNWGNDGSGEHCMIERSFKLQTICEAEVYELDDITIEEEKYVRTLLKKGYEKPLYVKIAILLKYIAYKLFGLHILK